MVGHKWNRPKTGSQAARKTHSGRIHAFDLVLAGSISADSGSPHKYDVRIKPCCPRGEGTRPCEISISGVEYSALHTNKLLRFARSGNGREHRAIAVPGRTVQCGVSLVA